MHAGQGSEPRPFHFTLQQPSHPHATFTKIPYMSRQTCRPLCEPMLAGLEYTTDLVRFRQRNSSSLFTRHLIFQHHHITTDFRHGRGQEAHRGLPGTGFELYAPGKLSNFTVSRIHGWSISSGSGISVLWVPNRVRRISAPQLCVQSFLFTFSFPLFHTIWVLDAEFLVPGF
jgi:hypothetical protein